MSRLELFAAALVIAIATAACGSQGPSSPSGIPAGGVSIIGTVAPPVPSGLRVSVGSTNTSASVDAAGQFRLDVAAGTADLRFTAPGVDASLPLTGLQSGQTVTLTLAISGSTVTVQTSRRVKGSDEELEGPIETLAANSFVVANRTVSTTGSTSYTANGVIVTFGTLAAGQRIAVKGQTSGTSVVATAVDILSPVSSSGLTVIGSVTGFSGTRSSFEMTVNGWLIRGDNGSTFDPGCQFDELADGLRIQITGDQQGASIYATRVVIVSQPVTLGGTISAKNGMVPTLTLSIGGKGVAVTALTAVSRKGDPQDALALSTGQTVDVAGRVRADGSIAASSINILSDAPGGGFWIRGTIGALSGTCPQNQVTVNGYLIVTNAQTVFDTPCDQLVAGDRVEVTGVVRSDMSVLASNVKKI